jgi:outer membrane protein
VKITFILKRILIAFAVLLLLQSNGISQDILTVEDAILLGLENNYGIQIARNEAEIDRLNRTLGNAGFLPTLTATGGREDVFESETVSPQGEPETSSDYEISLLSMDLQLDWTLFDGLRMFSNYRRLGEIERLGETLSTVEVENTISDIIRAYYEIVRQEKLLDVLENSVEISEERYSIAQTKRELGSGSEYELLLARSDLNADRAELIRQQVILNNLRLDLIRILDLDSDSEFAVADDIELSDLMTLDTLYPMFTENNRQIEAARIRTSISDLELRDTRRERLPEVSLNAGYTFSREETRNNFLLLDRTDGFYVGVTARFNIFDGFNTNRRVQTAKIRNKNEEIRLNEQLKDLEIFFLSEFKNYESAIDLIELENENLQLAEDALEIALEQFRLATITSVELRETQNILINTENRLIDAQFEAKISETELMRLSGILTDYN